MRDLKNLIVALKHNFAKFHLQYFPLSLTNKFQKLMTTSFDQPFKKFQEWFNKAKANSSIVEHTAMCLTTVDENHCPSSRMVLLKTFDENGFCFFTNFR